MPVSELFFTSDTHFDHAQVIDLNKRPFANVEEMNEGLIATWNEVVRPCDTVWHLGDFTFGPPERYQELVGRLHGTIHLILGNHDQKKSRLLEAGFASIHNTHYLRYEGVRIYLHHYACRTWRNSHKGSWHLYGHSHGGILDYRRSTDVGVDCWEYAPVSFKTLKGMMENREALNHHEWQMIIDEDC